MRNFIEIVKEHKLSLFIILIASAIIISLNYYSIKTTSGIRSYITAESNYAKGQKDAAKFLLHYLHTRNEELWHLYQENIAIPNGSKHLREGFLNNAPDSVLHKAMKSVRVNEKDFDNNIWLYKTFHQFSFFQKGLDIWTKADELVEKQNILASQVHSKIKNENLDSIAIKTTKDELFVINNQLSEYEFAFTDNFADTSLLVEKTLLLTNIFFGLLIVIGGGTYFISLINRLKQSKQVLSQNIINLETANAELDKFVYSVSHDLRSPITSAMGLIEVLKLEGETKNLPEYLSMMEESFKRQDDYIKKILSYSKNKRTSNKISQIIFSEFLQEIYNDLMHTESAREIKFHKAIEKESFFADELRLRIVLRNLISNAIQYKDPAKDSFIKITCSLVDNNIVIEVSDNGIGIKNEEQQSVFEMFFSGSTSTRGTGLGLYIVKDTVEKMGGNIIVTSEYGVGTTFKLYIPVHDSSVS